MKRSNTIFRLVACIACFFIFMSNIAHAQWDPGEINGEGTFADPWEITTDEHLTTLAEFVNSGLGGQTNGKYYKLMNGIDMRSYPNWNPIGTNLSTFQGNFNGNGKVISNLSINRSSTNYIGLFGYLSGATITNLGIEGCDINGGMYVGALAGYAGANTTISGCYTAGSIVGSSYIGGLVGAKSSV